MSRQKTIARPVHCSGIGLHTGSPTQVTLRPAPPNTGICFHRVDLEGAPAILARPEHILDVHYATTLGWDGVEVRTVEHLMAALAGLGIDNATVEVSGPEVPAMDGSAAPFVALLQQAGIKKQLLPKSFLRITKPIFVDMGPRRIEVLPAERFQVEYSVSFDHPSLRDQTVSMEISKASFIKEIAACRTYGFLRDLDTLRRRGLARGGSLENAVVIGDEGFLNPLRCEDELVRHKILDLIGDLYLLGRPVVGKVIARGAGHFLHAALVREIQRHLHSEGVAQHVAEEALPLPFAVSPDALGSPAL
ncbi:MAG: UDP-3-O-acyl-N-acetylglucosamine deacetylase [Candidatus Methylomirabilales bacterium]